MTDLRTDTATEMCVCMTACVFVDATPPQTVAVAVYIKIVIVVCVCADDHACATSVPHVIYLGDAAVLLNLVLHHCVCLGLILLRIRLMMLLLLLLLLLPLRLRL